MVKSSPWPFVTAQTLFIFVLPLVNFLHYTIYSSLAVFVSFAIFLLPVSYWSRDIIRESTFMGVYTLAVQKNLRTEMAGFFCCLGNMILSNYAKKKAPFLWKKKRIMPDWIYIICKMILLLFEFFKANIILLSQFVFFYPVFYFSLILSIIFTFLYLVTIKFVLRISLKTFLKFTIIYLKTRVVFFLFTHLRVFRVILAIAEKSAADVTDANQYENIMFYTSDFFYWCWSINACRMIMLLCSRFCCSRCSRSWRWSSASRR